MTPHIVEPRVRVGTEAGLQSEWLRIRLKTFIKIEIPPKSNRKQMCLIQLLSEDIVALVLFQWVKWPGRYWNDISLCKVNGMDHRWNLKVSGPKLSTIKKSPKLYTQVHIWLHFTEAKWRNLTSESHPKSINSINRRGWGACFRPFGVHWYLFLVTIFQLI